MIWASRTIRGICRGHVELAQPKVAKGDVACVVEQDVFWLQVTGKGVSLRRLERP